MELNVPLLKEICEIAGAPGYEKRINYTNLEYLSFK